MPDVFQFIDDIDADKRDMVITRLEGRAQMPKFAAIRNRYFDAVGLPLAGSIHELGCGTGAVCRAIAMRPGFTGTVVGSDLSADLIEKAIELAADAGLGTIEFHQADGQGSDAHDGQYDLVLAHTVISHVVDPVAFVQEAIRLAKPGGKIVIHDGDYASLTFDTGNPDLDRVMPGRYMKAMVANPHVMREMPRLLKQFDVTVTLAIGDVVVEAGTGDYFTSLAENYGPIAVAAGVVDQADFTAWMEDIARAQSENAFFGSCNFVTYCLVKPG